jgi:hypothetical protein
MKSLLAGLVLASSVVVGVGLTSPASALSCVMPSAVLDDAPVIFTGRIVERSHGQVVIDVDEVWKGDVDARVTYDVDLLQWWDESLKKVPGPPRAFAPLHGKVGPCTAFALRGPEADQVLTFRPASPAAPGGAEPVRQPSARGFDLAEGDQAWAWMVSGAAGGVLLVGALWWVLRRRRA